MHLAVLPDSRAARSPEALCVSDDDLSLNNSQFLAHVRAAAALLRGRGVGAGDVVAAMLPNRVEFVIALFSAWRLGATVTPINPNLTLTEAEYQLADSGAKLLISDIPGMRVDTIGAPELCAAAEPRDEPPVRQESEALALLIYTSGTTGKPKGVMLDHANLQAMCDMAIKAVELSEDDHSLLILPLFHVNGIVVSILSPLLVDGRSTIAGRFDPETFFSRVERVRPTYFSAVPAIYAMLLARPEEERPDLSSMRLAVCGAAPMPAALIERFENRFGIPVVEGYGLSEGTCASTINPVGGIRKPGTVGLPIEGQDVAIMDRSGNVLPKGETGEVVVRGPNVMRGYLNRPDDTSKAIVDGWLHTGDVGRFDEDGYLVLVDRIKDMIIRGGENIYPKEIESVLYGHTQVLEAAVVGTPHPVLGEVPTAFVATRPNATVDVAELHEHCRAGLSKYKLPTEIHLIDALPKNPVGKIDKPQLRERLAAMASRPA
ncbi:class I adenylate-forming enzyme family protein [Prauserella muralis]|uniref:AMP-dependent synthetase n=1 Tax=Prauserella muralis TaxID=588067 RepID=A0A2V4AF02_9PSEU|nr:AMP-binding protein [Prauserella muralis]PXY17406.1 AMP-dependent synthetase [Prauserella muralis]TWE23574.1 acyl-CoA synthetase (AMP-forming)/AMP-acid ligase II [Prauserella muralis]